MQNEALEADEGSLSKDRSPSGRALHGEGHSWSPAPKVYGGVECRDWSHLPGPQFPHL